MGANSLEYQTVSFPLVGAMDTKTAEPHLQRPMLSLAQNVWASQTGELRKRFGYITTDPLTDLDGNDIVVNYNATLRAMAGFRTSALVFTDRYAWIMETAEKKVAPVAGIMSTRVRVNNVIGTATDTVLAADHATVGRYTLFGTWEGTVGAGGNYIRWVVVDNTSGVTLTTGTIASGQGVRCVAHGNYLCLLFGSLAGSGTIEIFCKEFLTTSVSAISAGGLASSHTIVDDYDPGTESAAFDVVDNAQYGLFVVYRSTTANTLKWGFHIPSSGSLITNTSTAATVSTPYAPSCAVRNGTGASHGITYVRRTLASDLYALHRSFNGTVWTATATSAAIDTSLDTEIATQQCAFDQGGASSTLAIFYSGDAPTAQSDDLNLRTHKATYTTAGVIASRVATVYKAILASKPFAYLDKFYALMFLGQPTGLQPMLAIVSLDGSSANKEPLAGTPIAIISDNGFAISATLSALVSTNWYGQVVTLQTGKWSLSFCQRRFASSVATTQAVYPAAAYATVDALNYESHRAVEVGECIYIAGGVIYQYDGIQMVEAGFLRFVEPAYVETVNSTAGSLTQLSDYSYMIIPEWINAQGVREQGTNAGSVTVTLGALEDEITLYIPCIALTMKQNVSFAIYRTLANGDGAFYRIGVVENDPTLPEVSYNDRASDGSIDENELFPFADGALLDNAPMPSSYIMAEVGQRVYVASQSVRGKIFASKLREPDEALAFNDALVIQLPDDGCDIVGMAGLAGVLVVFTERGVYRVQGEGPANVTANGAPIGTWLAPELLSIDTGCLGQRSIVETPAGIMFRGIKGMTMLDQSFQMQYVGAPLENVETGTPDEQMSGLLLPGKQQIRYTSGVDSDVMFVFDYFHRAWFVWTISATGPDCLIDGTHYMPRGNTIWREGTVTFADDGTPFDVKVRLAWLRDPSSLMGEIRVRRIGVNGYCVVNTTLTVKTYRNFNNTSTVETLTRALTTNDAPFFAKWRPKTRVNASTQITLLEQGSTEGLRFHEVAFEVAVRSGGNSMGRT